MAIIDPNGLFEGERLRACSDMARIHWPYLFLATNGFGRIEWTYSIICRRAYVDFKKPPTQEELNQILDEYVKNYLAFPYRVGTAIWVQFSVKSGCLPRHKTARDRQSPNPPEPEYSEWLDAYLKSKSCVSMTSEFLPKIYENFGGLAHGVGVGVGVGVGEKHGQIPFEMTAENLTLAERQEQWFNEEFWPLFWRKVHRDEALKSFRKHATSEAAKNMIVARMIEHTPGYLSRQPDGRPHASTWLNQRRYLEEFEDAPPSTTTWDRPLSRADRIRKAIAEA